jgi:hypothetical protein
MTTLDRPASNAVTVSRLRPLAEARLVAIAVAAGLALGVGDLVWMLHVDVAWAEIANSSAVWAAGAFVLGAVLRTDPVRAAICGVVMMSVAVESYYVYAASVDLASLATPFSAHARMWLVFGVFAGVVFGSAGAWTSGAVRWQQVVGAATGAGVLLGEALHITLQWDLAFGGFRDPMAQAALAMSLLGVLLLVVTTRRVATFLAAALLTVPAALFCAAAFDAVGIGF